MTRNLAVFLLLALLPLSGCKKLHLPGKKGSEATVAAAPSEPSPPTLAGVEPPSKPELAPSPAGPTPPPRPAVDTTASVMVLCYHNIEDNSKMKALTIPVAEFEREMEAVKTAGFSVIGMQDFLAWRRGEKNIPKKSCVITLDDGWVSAYHNAWPILKKHAFPFTLFIYIDYVGSGGKSMTWDELAEMRDAGVDIQSHTYSHSNLHGKGLNISPKARKDLAEMGYDAWLRKEIIESKHVLEANLGIKCNVFAYPYGVYNAEARQVVKEGGYEAAFTVYGQRLSMHSPASDLLGRYAVEGGKPTIFDSALAMVGGGSSPAEASAAPVVAQLAAASMVTQPLNGETVMTATPAIKVNLSTMGEVEPGSLELRLSGVGALPVQFSPETKTLTAQVKQPLRAGPYTVIISGKVGGQRAETRWNFTVSNTAAGVPKPEPVAATPEPSATVETPKHAVPPKKKK